MENNFSKTTTNAVETALSFIDPFTLEVIDEVDYFNQPANNQSADGFYDVQFSNTGVIPIADENVGDFTLSKYI